MGLLLGFAPFVIFSLLTGISVDLALWVAFAAAFAIAIRDFAHTRILRILDVGSMILFGLLALYRGFIEPMASIQSIRLVVDSGLLAIALGSILAGNPFTLEYAREQVPQEFWDAPLFRRTNYLIAAIWSLAFGAMSAADAATIFSKHFPLTLDVATGLAALTLAVAFTARYPAHLRTSLARRAVPLSRQFD